MTETPKHIFILEDQTSCLKRLTSLVRQTLSINKISTARDLAQAYKCDTSQCQLGFIDLQLPDGNSFDFMTHHLQTYPHIPLIVTTLYNDDEHVFKALALGVSGYLLKSDNDELLLHSLNSLLLGQIPISPYIAKRLMQKVDNTEEQPICDGKNIQVNDKKIELSERELETLQYISKGLLTKQVAHEMGISTYTVNDVVKRIYRKCHIRNRIEAKEFASKHNLI